MSVNENTMYEEKSFWLRNYGTYKANEPLSEKTTADVCIIGAGFSGLSTAYEFKKMNANAEVIVIDAAVVGYGASGRNGGFSMKLFGLEPEVTVLRWGKEKTKEAHQYMHKAVSHVRELIEKHNLQSDYRHTGMFRVAYSDRQVKRLHKTFDLFQRLGLDSDMDWWSKERLNDQFYTERFREGMFESETGILDPCKHVRELKKLCESVGVKIYENTPATNIQQKPFVEVTTPNGKVRSEKLVICTNGYSHNVMGGELKKAQFPIWTYQVVTEPLTDEQWKSIGWENKQSFEDNRQLVHYFRPTADGRITMGGGTVDVAFGSNMEKDQRTSSWKHCEEHLKWVYPQLKDVKVAYKWGGPTSVNVDMTPEIGFLESDKVIFTCGCIGHGVSLTQLNGKLIAQLLSEQTTDLTDFWIVNRKAVRLPGDILSWMGSNFINFSLNMIDRFEERGLR